MCILILKEPLGKQRHSTLGAGDALSDLLHYDDEFALQGRYGRIAASRRRRLDPQRTYPVRLCREANEVCRAMAGIDGLDGSKSRGGAMFNSSS
jgi:hypothetical protein